MTAGRMKNTDIIGDDTHMTSMKIVQFSRSPTPLVHLLPKFFHSVDLGRPISKKTPPSSLQMVTNQLKENVNPRMTIYVIKFFLQFGLRFHYQLINIVWLSFDFFLFRWSLTICFFVALYSCVCKHIMKCLLFIIIHILSTHFAINLFYLHNLKT